MLKLLLAEDIHLFDDILDELFRRLVSSYELKFRVVGLPTKDSEVLREDIGIVMDHIVL